MVAYPKITVAGFDFLFTEPFEEFGWERVDAGYRSREVHRERGTKTEGCGRAEGGVVVVMVAGAWRESWWWTGTTGRSVVWSAFSKSTYYAWLRGLRLKN